MSALLNKSVSTIGIPVAFRKASTIRHISVPYDARLAVAAPTIPKYGINIAFNAIFIDTDTSWVATVTPCRFIAMK